MGTFRNSSVSTRIGIGGPGGERGSGRGGGGIVGTGMFPKGNVGQERFEGLCFGGRSRGGGERWHGTFWKGTLPRNVFASGGQKLEKGLQGQRCHRNVLTGDVAQERVCQWGSETWEGAAGATLPQERFDRGRCPGPCLPMGVRNLRRGCRGNVATGTFPNVVAGIFCWEGRGGRQKGPWSYLKSNQNPKQWQSRELFQMPPTAKSTLRDLISWISLLRVNL